MQLVDCWKIDQSKAGRELNMWFYHLLYIELFTSQDSIWLLYCGNIGGKKGSHQMLPVYNCFRFHFSCYSVCAYKSFYTYTCNVDMLCGGKNVRTKYDCSSQKHFVFDIMIK